MDNYPRSFTRIRGTQEIQSNNLIRKQYLVSERNVRKLKKLASEQGTSSAEIVRLAIEASDPESVDHIGQDELMRLASSRLKEAIEDTRNTRRRLNKYLRQLDKSAA